MGLESYWLLSKAEALHLFRASLGNGAVLAHEQLTLAPAMNAPRNQLWSVTLIGCVGFINYACWDVI